MTHKPKAENGQVFTDDDLAILKEFHSGFTFPIDNRINHHVSLGAIFERLEAAENLLKLWMLCDADCEIDGSILDTALTKWLAAKGKASGKAER